MEQTWNRHGQWNRYGMDMEDNGTWNRHGMDMEDIGTWNRHGTDMDNGTNMEWTWKAMEPPDTPHKQP